METTRPRGHGEGSIRKRKPGLWESRGWFDGKRRSFYGAKRKEALNKLKEAQRRHEEGRLPDGKTQTVGRYLDSWLADVEPTVRPETLRSYRLNVERVKPHIGRIRLDQLKAPAVQNCYTKLLADGLSKRSVQQAGTVLHKALSDAQRLGHVGFNACDSARAPSPAKQEMRVLSADELVQLFEATASDRYHALWVVLGTTGLRLGEALGLKWSDVDLTRKSLTVRRALQRQTGRGLQFIEPKSKGSKRTVELLDLTVDALRAHRERQTFERKAALDRWHDQDLIFASPTGTPLEQGGIWKHWTAALDKAGLPHIRRHDLRHTAATLRLQAGANVKVVQELLGHSSITLTLDTYSHVTPGMQRESADALDALLSSKRGANTQRVPG